MKPKKNTQKSELLNLKYVGPVMLKSLHILNITTIDQLADKTPEELYEKLHHITGTKPHVCVLYVLAAIIHEARTGEQVPWWYWNTPKKQASIRSKSWQKW